MMIIVCRGVKFRWSFQKFMINLLICVTILTVSALYLTNSVKAVSTKNTSTITVQHGDTLWSIAKRIAPDRDPRVVIEQIKMDNQLRDSSLTAGLTLKIANID